MTNVTTRLLGSAGLALVLTSSAFAAGAQSPGTQNDAYRSMTGAQHTRPVQHAQADNNNTNGTSTSDSTSSTGSTTTGSAATGSGNSDSDTSGSGNSGSDTTSGNRNTDGTGSSNAASGRAGSEGAQSGDAQSGSTAPNTSEQGPQIAALEVESQAVEDGKINIDLAYMPQDGFVAVYEVEQGKLSTEALGSAPLEAGENDDVSVTLDGPVEPGETLVAVLHQDTGEIGTFEFSGTSMDVDGPELIGGRPVAVPFMILAEGDQNQTTGTNATGNNTTGATTSGNTTSGAGTSDTNTSGSGATDAGSPRSDNTGSATTGTDNSSSDDSGGRVNRSTTSPSQTDSAPTTSDTQ